MKWLTKGVKMKSLSNADCNQKVINKNLLSYIENGKLHSFLAEGFSINDIKEAQEEFLAKKHIGNFVIAPG
jgi:NADPH:quinone reductase-like Zn-dependent oxidoreductase